MSSSASTQQIRRLQDGLRALEPQLDSLSSAELSELARLHAQLGDSLHARRERIAPRGLHSGAIPHSSHQELLNAMIEADPAGMAVLAGQDLEVVFSNPTFRFLISDPNHDPLGRPYRQICTFSSADNFQENLKRTLQTGRPFQSHRGVREGRP